MTSDEREDGGTPDERTHSEALERFELCNSADAQNREDQRDDIKFVKMREQWPEAVLKHRTEAGRPCLVVDQLGSVCRQVVNDARLNKPSIKVKPVDSKADPKTAEILSGLIRNIEYSSNADVAYDTALDYAVTSGRGYFRVNAEYASDDTFDQDLIIHRISDPLSVFPDPYGSQADSSDWNFCFIVDSITEDDYERKYKGKDVVNWDSLSCLGNDWFGDERAVIAEYWVREEAESYAVMLSSGETVQADVLPKVGDQYAEGIPALGQDMQPVMDPMTGEQVWLQEPVMVQAVRPIRSHKVTQYILSGAEILETVDWPGKYIPIIPVYGDDFIFDGRRYFSSLIRPAKDAQRMKNYWRSTTTELVALAPKSPWIGPSKAFEGDDSHKWETANEENWAYIAYEGQVPPQRQPFAGVPAGALQEALNAVDDIKQTTGVFDASLGARSNETSGKAIMARQREGDVSTFHFIDNLSRAIRHCGRILIDLIPHYYSSERVIRILNPEGEPESVTVGSPEAAEEAQRKQVEMGQEVQQIYALGVGKYDVAVDSGPSFTTQREEANAFLTELLRSAPQYAELIGPLLLKTYDFPGVDKILEEIEQRKEQAAQSQGQPDPEQQAKQAEMQLKAQEAQANYELEQRKLELDLYRAETDRMKAVNEIQQPRGAPRTYAG